MPSGASDTTLYEMYRDSLVSSTSWLDPSDSSIVCVASSSLEAGRKYIFKEWPSRGDSIQNSFYTLNIKSSEAIQLSTSGISADSTYPNNSLFSQGIYTINQGDTAFWIAPTIADSFQFTHWSCRGFLESTEE